MKETRVTQRFGLACPIIQAPMAGGGDTPALVAAVCEAGGMGFIGAAYLTPDAITEAAAAVRARTDRPFGINLFAPQPAPDRPDDLDPMLEPVAPFYAELGLPPPSLPDTVGDSFARNLPAALESGAAALSFTFGTLPADATRTIKAKGMAVIGTATTVAEAQALEQTGVDAIVAQGSEAGGHRGTFPGDEPGMVGTMALVPLIADAVGLPVIASGGIMDGRGIAAALALGADAVQMGTAFLTCDEAGVSDAYKDTILAAREDESRLTRAFSGRAARGIVNRFMTAVDTAGAILPFPLQNALTRPMRAAAGKAGKTDYLSLWAGQGGRLARREPAAATVARLVRETEAAIAGLTTGT